MLHYTGLIFLLSVKKRLVRKKEIEDKMSDKQWLYMLYCAWDCKHVGHIYKAKQEWKVMNEEDASFEDASFVKLQESSYLSSLAFLVLVSLLACCYLCQNWEILLRE